MFGGKATAEQDATGKTNQETTVPQPDEVSDESKEKPDNGKDDDHSESALSVGKDSPQKSEVTEEKKGDNTTSWWSTATQAFNIVSSLSASLPDMVNLDAKTVASGAAAKGVDVKDLSGQAGNLQATAAAKGVEVKDLAKNADKDQLIQALAAEQNASGLLSKALSLKDKAMKAMNPVERQRMLQESYDNEIKAKGQSKMAQRMQSGLWQGGIGGAGIGGGVGAGVGGLVGTLVGGVVALPTTAVGGLVGAGVGSITGPIVKLDQTMAKAVDGKMKEVEAKAKKEGKSKEEIEKLKQEAVKKISAEDLEKIKKEEEAKKKAEAKDGAGAKKGSPPGKAAEGETGKAMNTIEEKDEAGEAPKPKKKPRKIEVRSKTATAA